MAAGRVLPHAIADLAALPADAYERAVAEEVLVHLQRALGQKTIRTPEEEEFIMTMQSTWEQARNEGHNEGTARAVLTVLHVRGIAVPDTVRERILAVKDADQLRQWLEKATVAASLAEVLGESNTPSQRI